MAMLNNQMVNHDKTDIFMGHGFQSWVMVGSWEPVLRNSLRFGMRSGDLKGFGMERSQQNENLDLISSFHKKPW